MCSGQGLLARLPISGVNELILLTAVLAGTFAGVVRARIGQRRLRIPDLRAFGLLILAYLPQLVVFRFPFTRHQIPDSVIPVILIASMILLVFFAWLNLELPGFWFLLLGTLFNALVILFNDGLMPISPETVRRLAPELPMNTLVLGERLGTSKDVLLNREVTQLWWFSDRLILPDWVPWQAALSWGDILIAFGTFWFLWSLGNSKDVN